MNGEVKMKKWRITDKKRRHAQVDVEGIDKLRAIQAAAKLWGERWTEIAHDCGAAVLCEVMQGDHVLSVKDAKKLQRT